MRRLKSFLAYTAAVLLVPIVLMLFIELDVWARGLVDLTGLTVSPWYTGGETARCLERGKYRVIVHRPVFDGLCAERGKGFVQLDWTPPEGLPRIVDEEIDMDGDGRQDLRLLLDTAAGTVELTAENPAVIGVREVLRLRNAWAVRVDLWNPKKLGTESERCLSDT